MQQVETNSFYVTNIGKLSEVELQQALSCAQVKIYTWDIGNNIKSFAEVFYNSISEAELAYNTYNNLEIANHKLRFLVKRALTRLWLSGLPPIIYARDLFTCLQDLTPGLLRITIPRHPE